ncbi:hypothetical protein HDU99_000343 [Rhizoclosmatium hyalinum]|nr:hypothetical protein HDU99_000343 [Rhizoclosmatium hyalinum]
MASFVTVQKKKEYAIVTLNRGPVNALNLKFWKDLQAALDEVQSDKAMRALIFQSGLEKDIFTAGNDLTELYAPLTSLEKYTEFWTTQNVFLGNLYASRLVTVSVIRGACPAGGCAISMCCDYRIMSKDIGHIGLNEPQIGLMVPVVWMELFTKIIGHRQAELLGFNGSVVSPAEAKRIGLVDLLVAKDELLPTAEAVVSQFLKVPSFGRSLTKQVVHKDLADKFRNRKMLKDQSDAGWQFLTAEPTLKVKVAILPLVFQREASLVVDNPQEPVEKVGDTRRDSFLRRGSLFGSPAVAQPPEKLKKHEIDPSHLKGTELWPLEEGQGGNSADRDIGAGWVPIYEMSLIKPPGVRMPLRHYSVCNTVETLVLRTSIKVWELPRYLSRARINSNIRSLFTTAVYHDIHELERFHELEAKLEAIGRLDPAKKLKHHLDDIQKKAVLLRKIAEIANANRAVKSAFWKSMIGYRFLMDEIEACFTIVKKFTEQTLYPRKKRSEAELAALVGLKPDYPGLKRPSTVSEEYVLLAIRYNRKCIQLFTIMIFDTEQVPARTNIFRQLSPYGFTDLALVLIAGSSLEAHLRGPTFKHLSKEIQEPKKVQDKPLGGFTKLLDDLRVLPRASVVSNYSDSVSVSSEQPMEPAAPPSPWATAPVRFVPGTKNRNRASLLGTSAAFASWTDNGRNPSQLTTESTISLAQSSSLKLTSSQGGSLASVVKSPRQRKSFSDSTPFLGPSREGSLKPEIDPTADTVDLDVLEDGKTNNFIYTGEEGKIDLKCGWFPAVGGMSACMGFVIAILHKDLDATMLNEMGSDDSLGLSFGITETKTILFSELLPPRVLSILYRVVLLINHVLFDVDGVKPNLQFWDEEFKFLLTKDLIRQKFGHDARPIAQSIVDQLLRLTEGISLIQQ